MLDVLIPVAEVLERGEPSSAAVIRAAHAAADATIPVKAVRGRASFLGDRSVGHMDPGARSSALLIEAIGSILEKA
jgi:dihydroxyacetone kinase-like protein